LAAGTRCEDVKGDWENVLVSVGFPYNLRKLNAKMDSWRRSELGLSSNI
jgi:hypothetical protein